MNVSVGERKRESTDQKKKRSGGKTVAVPSGKEKEKPGRLVKKERGDHQVFHEGEGKKKPEGGEGSSS